MSESFLTEFAKLSGLDLSPAQQKALLRDIVEEVARRRNAAHGPESFTDFKRHFWPGYQHTIHHAALDELLTQVGEYLRSDGQRGLGRVIITIPPRHGKTESVRNFCAYLLGLMPDLRIISASYSHHLANESSRRVRNLIMSTAYQDFYPHIRIDGTRAAVRQWDIAKHRGGMIAVGVGGSIVGFGGQLIIVDDPTKSRHEAESPIMRQRLKNWYGADLRTRLEPPGAMIVVAARWHTDDLPGYLLEDDIEGWHVLHLPALAEENDVLGREPGEALWPDRYPPDKLLKIQEQLGQYDFSALYQCRPIPRGDSLFDVDKIEVVTSLPRDIEAVRFWDLAVSEKKTADYTASVLLGIDRVENLFVLDVLRRQMSPTSVGEAIITKALQDGTGVPVYIEAENSSRVQLDYLLKDSRLRGYSLTLVTPQGSKFVRATPVATRVNARKLKIVQAEWNRAFLDELSLFPGVKNDDQTDALSGAYFQLSGAGSVRVDIKQGVVRDPRRRSSFGKSVRVKNGRWSYS